MLTKDKILEIARQKGRFLAKDLAENFKVSRQYVNILIKELISANKLLKIGSTRKAFYVFPDYVNQHPEILPFRYVKTFKNNVLEEHKILSQIEQDFPLAQKLSENIRSIFTYAFSEMLNNAIEHSQSENVHLEVSIQNNILSFIVEDSESAFLEMSCKKEISNRNWKPYRIF